MPNHLAYLADHVLNRVEGTCPIDLCFEPFPKPFNRIVLGGIRRQVLKLNPVMLLHKSFHQTASVDLSVVEDQKDERIAKALMELMEKGNEGFGRAAWCSFPVHLLCAQMKRSKEGRALALGWTRNLALFAFATPAPLYIGLIAPVGFIGKEDFNTLRLSQLLDGVNDLCHPLFFCSALGAL